MSRPEFKPTKWMAPDGNVYGVEQASNGRFIVVRTNPGGNRKGSREFGASGRPEALQRLLDLAASERGWKELKSEKTY